MTLTHLFDAELEYRADMAPVVATGEGELIGSGDGVVRGERIEGTLRWTLFEQPGELICGMNPALVIITADGAEIRAEARGYARRENKDDRRWQVAATLLFHAPDERYTWLDGRLAVWQGEFDAEVHRARYRAYTAAEARPASFTRAEDWRARRNELESGERALYREILLAFAHGQWPTRDSLAPLSDELGIELSDTLAHLRELDLVRADEDTGQVIAAYPFSGRPTAHRLELPDGHEAFAMCAVDALGVASMLGSPVIVRSRDPISGEAVVVDVSPDGEARWSPEQAVVFVGGRDGEQAISDLCCPVVNFFASRETARGYVDANPDLAGRIAGVPEALAGGRAIFEEALR